MPDLTQQQRDVFDLLARLIDAPLQSRDEENLTAEQRAESRLKQLPYAIEHAVVAYLYRRAPDLFAVAPRDRFPLVSYLDATEDLASFLTCSESNERTFLIAKTTGPNWSKTPGAIIAPPKERPARALAP